MCEISQFHPDSLFSSVLFPCSPLKLFQLADFVMAYVPTESVGTAKKLRI